MVELSPEARRWRRVAFWVPTGIALGTSLLLNVLVRVDGDMSGGYQGLLFLVTMPPAFVACLLWLGVGALVARARGPPGATRAFLVGAAAATGAALLALTVGCFAAYV